MDGFSLNLLRSGDDVEINAYCLGACRHPGSFGATKNEAFLDHLDDAEVALAALPNQASNVSESEGVHSENQKRLGFGAVSATRRLAALVWWRRMIF